VSSIDRLVAAFSPLKVGFAQINATVGDLDGNLRRILDDYQSLVSQGAEVVLTPELALTGYPPLDLVFKSQFVPQTLARLGALHAQVGEVPLVVGYVDRNASGSGQPFRNAAAVLVRDQPIQKVWKSHLPTYDVFDEDRYFEPASDVQTAKIAGQSVGITICEDIWTEQYLPGRLYHGNPVRDLATQGATAILNLSASPFVTGKPALRRTMLSSLAKEHRLPMYYCNLVGGNDQLVFDGHSLAVDAHGNLMASGPGFEAAAFLSGDGNRVDAAAEPDIAQLHRALVLGLRDYCRKCGFRSVVLGLSGGIDSAITAAIAAEALGAQNVTGVALPTEFSSDHSVADARRLAETLGMHFHVLPIQAPFQAVKQQLQPLFEGLAEDVTEENIQPRLRATLLMALANKFGHLLLTTGNKSELAVGYCTIYGDMAGGLSVISDVPKTRIYELAHWMNRQGEIIPQNTIIKPPSAELRPDQKDQDTLPPYDYLDAILELYVEKMMTARDIIAQGFDEQTVRWVARRVDLNEWKRAQAAPGLKVTSKAFGVGRRMPIAQRFVD